MAPLIFEQNRQSGQEIAEDSMDADVAVQEYRWFRQQWQDIQAARAQLENYQQQEQEFHQTWGNDTDDWSRQAQTRHGRIHDRITGQRNNIETLIADYNARQSDATRAIFNCGLPYNIDEQLYIADASGVEYTSQEAASNTPPEDVEDCDYQGTITRSDD